MKLFSPRAFIPVSACTIVGILVITLLVWRSTSGGRLSELFEGPVTICKSEKALFYPRLYDSSVNDQVSQNAASEPVEHISSPESAQDGEMEWVDGEARGEIEAAMRKYTSQMDRNTALSRPNYHSAYREQIANQLRIVSPEDGSLYPANLCPPYVSWKDPCNNLWRVEVEFGGETQKFVTDETRWKFPQPLWERVRESAVSRNASVVVKGITRDEQTGNRLGDIHATEPFHFRISEHPADPYLVYRLVEPPFSTHKTPDIFVRDIRKERDEIFLSARREYCLNCHNFSSKQGNTGKLAFQVRSMVKVMNDLPTYLAVYDIDKREGFKVRLPFEIQMTTFMAWSPDGGKLAYSANQKVATLKPIVFETQFAAMGASDIAIYDLDRGDTYLVPGASDPNVLEIYPLWSPDGSKLVFSRSPVGAHPSQILYDLYVLDLGTTENPTPQPIEGAAENGRSNYYARFSPDGKWFTFCQSDGGDLIRSSSDLYILPGSLQGPARRLECNADHAADSWYSWSSNSRWIVFASKREGGIYASLYLTHIDDGGHASPAIPLPVDEKAYWSFNIPEFVRDLPPIDENDLFDALRVEPKPREVRLREISQGTREDLTHERS